MKRVLIAVFVFGLCAFPAVASAQEKGKTALTIAHPTSVGVLWHASDRVAVRPDFTFSISNTDAGVAETSTDSIGLGVSLLWYVKKWDQVSAYWAPRYAWTRAKGTSESSLTDDESSSTLTSHTVSGSFGVQGWIGTRFSAFGEVGLVYSRTKADTESSFSFDTTSTTFAPRSGVGIAFYF